MRVFLCQGFSPALRSDRPSKVLNAPIEDLHGIEKKPGGNSGPPSQLEQRIAALRELPCERQKIVLQVLDRFLRDAPKAG